MKQYCCIIVYLLSYTLALSQQMVSGRVVDAGTGSPLPSVSVYLNNTSMGTTTNENGEFHLDHIPPAKYTLIVSGVSFKTFSKIIDTRGAIPDMTIKLSSSADLLKGATVRAPDPAGWEQWGKLFTQLFVGMSPLAQECRIVNPEVIKFRKNDDNTLTVYADKPILLHNTGLGYDIRYTLEDFTYDFPSSTVIYSGYALFKDLSLTHARKAAAWRKARQETYQGSFLHFKRSFFANALFAQGFEMHSLAKIVNTQKARAGLLFSKRPLLRDTIAKTIIGHGNYRYIEYRVVDSTNYYKDALKQPDTLISHQFIPADSVGFAEDSSTAGFYFPDSLEVNYLLIATPGAYRRTSPAGRHEPHPVSQLVFFNKRPIYILFNGFHYEPEDVKISGYWAWSETMGTMLPFDYNPTQ
jgi:hypothetical protein